MRKKATRAYRKQEKKFTNRIARLCHIHWFRFHHQCGMNVYEECRCGKRNWYPLFGGYSPLDLEWLNASNKTSYKKEL